MQQAAGTNKIAVVGTGAVGCYYGGLLAEAGEDVHFLFRSDYAAVLEKGLTVRHRAADSEFTLRPNAYDKPEDIGECDLVVVAAKATFNKAVAPALSPLVGRRTTLLLLQNGMGNAEFFAERFPEARVLCGLCFVCINKVAPGVVENYFPGYLKMGRHGGPPDDATRITNGMFRRAGVDAEVLESMAEALWRKLMWNVPFNGLAIAAGGVTTDKIIANPHLTAEARALMRELQTAAKAEGFDIPESFIDLQFSNTRRMGAYKPSSLIDYLARREVEVDPIWGAPLRRGKGLGIEMPRLSLLHALLTQLCRWSE